MKCYNVIFQGLHKHIGIRLRLKFIVVADTGGEAVDRCILDFDFSGMVDGTWVAHTTGPVAVCYSIAPYNCK